MVNKNNRIQRITQEMQKKIAIILQRKIKDSRISMITVTSLGISCDLTDAKVFVTFLHNNNTEQIKTTIKVLQNASGFIRKQLGKIMYLRIIPQLTFMYDHSLMEGIRISNLVKLVLKNN